MSALALHLTSSWVVLAMAGVGVWQATEQSSVAPPARAERLLAWPFEQAAGAEIYQTYGQAERVDWLNVTDESETINVHHGLDIACHAGTKVYAPVSGRVAAIFDEGQRSYTKGLAIRPFDEDENWTVQLLHIEVSSLQFALGDSVRSGDFVGELAAWPDDSVYEPHLHVALGRGSLSAQANGPDRTTALLLFAETRNPLLHLDSPPDTDPPRVVVLGERAEEPFVFRSVVVRDDGTLQRARTPLDPTRLSGLVDIDVAVVDRVRADSCLVVAPLEVRIEVASLYDDVASIARRIRFEEGDYEKGSADFGIYLPATRTTRCGASAFVYHFMTMRPVNPEDADNDKALPLDTSRLPTGCYRVSAFAADRDNEALLGEMLVSIVTESSR